MADRVTVAQIQAAVCLEFGVDLMDLLSMEKANGAAIPRQVGMFLARELTHLSLPTIGRLCFRHHATVMYSIQRIAGLMAADLAFEVRVNALQARIQGNA